MENAYSGRVRTETKRRKDTSCNIEALLSTLVVEATLWRVPQSKFGTNRLRNKRLTAEKPIAVEWRRRGDAFVLSSVLLRGEDRGLIRSLLPYFSTDSHQTRTGELAGECPLRLAPQKRWKTEARP